MTKAISSRIAGRVFKKTCIFSKTAPKNLYFTIALGLGDPAFSQTNGDLPTTHWGLKLEI